MGINYAPYAGQILLCDFRGSIRPEMEKTRPVVILTPRTISKRTHTTTIVPLSTTDPRLIEPYHIRLQLPGTLPEHWSAECWAKCDMVATVSFSRLGFMKLGKTIAGKRLYYKELLDDQTLSRLRKAVQYAIGYAA
jgi:mRNA interferase MazF